MEIRFLYGDIDADGDTCGCAACDDRLCITDQLKGSSASQEKQHNNIIKKWEYEADDAERAAIEKHVGWQRVDCVYPLIRWERENYRFTGTEAYFDTSIRTIHIQDIRDIQHFKDRFSRMCAVRQCLRTVMVIPEGRDPVKVVRKEPDSELFYVDMRKQRYKVERYIRTLQKIFTAPGLDQVRPLILCGIVRTGEYDYELPRADESLRNDKPLLDIRIHLDPDICDPKSAVMIAEGMKKAIEIILKQ